MWARNEKVFLYFLPSILDLLLQSKLSVDRVVQV